MCIHWIVIYFEKQRPGFLSILIIINYSSDDHNQNLFIVHSQVYVKVIMFAIY